MALWVPQPRSSPDTDPPPSGLSHRADNRMVALAANVALASSCSSPALAHSVLPIVIANPTTGTQPLSVPSRSSTREHLPYYVEAPRDSNDQHLIDIVYSQSSHFSFRVVLTYVLPTLSPLGSREARSCSPRRDLVAPGRPYIGSLSYGSASQSLFFLHRQFSLLSPLG